MDKDLYKNLDWKNFWDINGYEPTLKRCDDGYDLVCNLKKCLKERYIIDKNYHIDVSDWREKWRKFVKKSTEYGGCNNAWLDHLEKEVQTVKNYSEESLQLLNYSNELGEWLKKHYQKHIIHFYQQKLFLEEFQKHQKDWKESLEKLLKYKQELASLNRKKETENIKEAIFQIREKIESRQKKLGSMQITYKDDMIKTFELAQELERKRKQVFKNVFDKWFNFVKARKDTANLSQVLYEPEQDLLWYYKNYGPGMDFKISYD